MSLPETVCVKLSSEAADWISITPVVVRDMPLRELVEHLLGVTGKDESRLIELLLRGTLVSGASRFRWTGWEADRSGLRDLLATFPDPDPGRAFAAGRCVRAVLHTPGRHIELSREVGRRKQLLRRTSFWDVLMSEVSKGEIRYFDYSYREHADRYMAKVSPEGRGRLRDCAGLIRYTTLRDLVRSAALESADLYVER